MYHLSDERLGKLEVTVQWAKSPKKQSV